MKIPFQGGSSMNLFLLSNLNAKKLEDPKAHVLKFKSVFQAIGIWMEQERNNLLPCTLKGVSIEWFV